MGCKNSLWIFMARTRVSISATVHKSFIFRFFLGFLLLADLILTIRKRSSVDRQRLLVFRFDFLISVLLVYEMLEKVNDNCFFH